MADTATPAVADTVPADTGAAAKPAKPKNQAALQVPKFAQKLIAELGVKLDEKAKHVIAAAVLLFREQPPEVQVAAISAARIEYVKNAKTECE